jgi:hypothetical protein
MGLVFVHGVNTRMGEGSYRPWVNNYVQKFRTVALIDIIPDPTNFPIFSPYWGEDAAKFRWSLSSLPVGSTEAFGGDAAFTELLQEVAPEEQVPQDQFLLSVARESLEDCAALVYAALEQASAAGDIPPPPATWMQDALAHVDKHKSSPPDYVYDAANDDELTASLLQAVEEERAARESASPPTTAAVDSFSIAKTAANRALAVTKWVSRKAYDLGLSAVTVTAQGIRTLRGATARMGRAAAHNKFALFLGDVAVYLTERGTVAAPGPIVKTILDDFRKAAATSPLIVVAHSMGGNISYDIFTTFDPDLHVDLFLTVGSQVSLLEEAKLFVARDEEVPSPEKPKTRKPMNVHRWLNVFDQLDPFAYCMEPVFEGVEDFEFNTRKTVFGAHGAYFNRDNFYERLRQKIKEMKP